MPNAALAIVEEEIAREPRGGNVPVRAQLAFIRSLVDEIKRSSGGAARARALREQLFDEMTRLRRMVSERHSRPPMSGAPPRT